MAGGTRRIEKYCGETCIPASTSGSPSPVRFVIRNCAAAMSSKLCVRSHQSRKLNGLTRFLKYPLEGFDSQIWTIRSGAGKGNGFSRTAFTTVKIAVLAPERIVQIDRKSTRLNSSHQIISYAVFC